MMRRKLLQATDLTFVLALLVAAIIPNFARARHSSSSEPIVFEIKVVDPERNAPVGGAKIALDSVGGVTNDEGHCTIVQHFPATGIVGRCLLSGALRVTVPGRVAWERLMDGLFGETYDYFNRGATITQLVMLARQ